MYHIDVAAPHQLDEVRSLIREYIYSLNVAIWFEDDLERELAGLPGQYDPILLSSQASGCVALRPLSDTVAEMKRLYVRPAHRGHGLGRRLAESIIQAARDRGYRSIRLDTLPWLDDAIALYRRLGFRDIPPYCYNPIPGALFLELTL